MPGQGEGQRNTRRSPRILWRRPVLVTCESNKRETFRDLAETEIINAHGGLLRLFSALPAGQPVRLYDSSTGNAQEAHVVWSRQEQPTVARMAVELIPPSETFWGIRIPILVE